MPLLQFTPFKFDFLINLAKTILFLLYGILVYPIASGTDPSFRDTTLGLAPPL